MIFLQYKYFSKDTEQIWTGLLCNLFWLKENSFSNKKAKIAAAQVIARARDKVM